MPVKITYYKPNEDKDATVIAWVSVCIEEWDLTFTKCKLVRSKTGGWFLAPPSEKYTDSSGQTKYLQHWWFGKNSNDRFQEAVHKAVDEYVKTNRSAQKSSSSSQPTQPSYKKSYAEEAPSAFEFEASQDDRPFEGVPF